MRLHETIEQLKQLGLESVTHAIDETTHDRLELAFQKTTVFSDVSELNDDDLRKALQSVGNSMLPEFDFSDDKPVENKPATEKRNTDSFLGAIKSPHNLFKKQKVEMPEEATSRADSSTVSSVTPK